MKKLIMVAVVIMTFTSTMAETYLLNANSTVKVKVTEGKESVLSRIQDDGGVKIVKLTLSNDVFYVSTIVKYGENNYSKKDYKINITPSNEDNVVSSIIITRRLVIQKIEEKKSFFSDIFGRDSNREKSITAYVDCKL